MFAATPVDSFLNRIHRRENILHYAPQRRSVTELMMMCAQRSSNFRNIILRLVQLRLRVSGHCF